MTLTKGWSRWEGERKREIPKGYFDLLNRTTDLWLYSQRKKNKCPNQQHSVASSMSLLEKENATFNICLRGMLDRHGKGSARKWEYWFLDLFYNNPIRNSLDSLGGKKIAWSKDLEGWCIIWEVYTQASKAKEKGMKGRLCSDAKWCLTDWLLLCEKP